MIYTVERVAPWAVSVRTRLEQPDIHIVVSDLTRLECRVKPIREQDATLLADFDRYFREDVDETVPICREAADRATLIRAEHRFHTPDALHLGAALASGCDAFLTNDHRLDGFPDIEIEVVEDLGEERQT